MTTKEKIINELLDSKDKTISGESLAACCNVSRAAIWKAITALRAEGFDIEGTTNGGYVLKNQGDAFSKEIIVNELSKAFPQFAQSHIECFKEIDSTNTYAKRELSLCGALRNTDGSLTDNGKKYHQAIFVAESQTAGRGRLGRSFCSPAKTGIYLSVIYAPKGGITNPARLTAFTAVAACRAIKKLYNIDSKIKWINDIYINQKKVAGILTEGFTNFETAQIESAVIGIGVNITENQNAFPDEVKKVAGSILDRPSHTAGRAELAARIAGEIFSVLEENPKDVIAEYKALSFLLGKEITVHPVIGDVTKTYQATAIDIDNNAGLVVKLSDGTERTLNSGEVSVRQTSL